MDKKPFFRAAIDDPSSVSRRQLAHAQSLLKLRARQAAIIEAAGLDAVAELAAAGLTQAEMAAQLGCDAGSLGTWIANQNGESAVVLASARRASAPANMDRALGELVDVDVTTPGAVQIAIQRSKHFQLRAALADRRGYSERLLPQDLIQAAHPTAIPSFTVNVYPTDNPKNTLTISQYEDISDADLI